MEFTFDGESSGIAFQGSTVEDGFYSCTSLNQNLSGVINLSDFPFNHDKAIKNEGYSQLESSQIKSSSWLRDIKLQ